MVTSELISICSVKEKEKIAVTLRLKTDNDIYIHLIFRKCLMRMLIGEEYKFHNTLAFLRLTTVYRIILYPPISIVNFGIHF